MKGTDRFLIILVIGIVTVIVVTVVVATQRPGQNEYQPEDTPENVVFNYLLALQRGDYQRAYSYLSPDVPYMPVDSEQMAEDLKWQIDRLQDSSSPLSLSIESSHVARGTTIVTAAQTWTYRGDLLSSNHQTYTFEVELRPVAGAWKIVDSEDYWDYDWSHRSN